VIAQWNCGGSTPSCSVGMACDDGNACTTGDSFTANCDCVGTYQDTDSDGVCDSDDICQGGDDNADADGNGTPDACDTNNQMGCQSEIVDLDCYSAELTVNYDQATNQTNYSWKLTAVKVCSALSNITFEIPTGSALLNFSSGGNYGTEYPGRSSSRTFFGLKFEARGEGLKGIGNMETFTFTLDGAPIASMQVEPKSGQIVTTGTVVPCNGINLTTEESISNKLLVHSGTTTKYLLAPTFNVAPSPATHTATITLSHFEGQAVQLAVFNKLGQQVLNKTIVLTAATMTEAVDVQAFQSGLYFVTIQQASTGLLLTEKLVVKHN